MNNNIIKHFDVDPSLGLVTSDGVNVYITMVLNKENIISKDVKFIKICIVKSDDLTGKNFNLKGYANSYENMLYRNNSQKIKQYVFEDVPVSLLQNSEVNQEITFSIPVTTINQSIQEVTYTDIKRLVASEENRRIVLVGDPANPNSETIEEVPESEIVIDRVANYIEKPHTFKIYFLNNKKSIVENYTYPQEENVRLDDYIVNVLEDEIENVFFNNINIDFNDFTDNFEAGPVISGIDKTDEVYADLLEKTSLEISYKNNSYMFENIKENISSKMISQFKDGIIFCLYEDYIIEKNLQERILNLNFYKDGKVFMKQKLITRDKILSLYNSYFRKWSSRFISEAFRNKITTSRIDSQQNIFSITFLTPETKYIPIEKSQFNVYLKNNNTSFDIFTSTSLTERFKIIPNNNLNKSYSYETIFKENIQESNVYFFRGQQTNSQSIIIKINSFIIFPVTEDEDIDDSNNDIQDEEDSFTNNPAGFFAREIINNIALKENFVIADINKKLIYERRSLFENIGYNIDNNDFFGEDIVEETIIQYKATYNNNKGEKIEIVRSSKLSDVIVGEQLKIPIESSLKNLTINLETITLPKGSIRNILDKKNVDEEEKENISSHLNSSYIRKNTRTNKFNNLIDNKLYTLNLKRQDKFKEIFDLTGSKNIKTYKIKEENTSQEENNENLTEEVTPSGLSYKQQILDNNYLQKNILNVKLESSLYKKHLKTLALYKIKNNSIHIFKRKKDRVIAKLDLRSLLRDLNLNDKDLSFNISMLISFEFDKKLFKKQNVEFSDLVIEDSFLLNQGSFYFKQNLSFSKDGDTLSIFGPKDSYSEIDENAYDKFNLIWGKNRKVYFTNLIQRYCILISKENKLMHTILINNYVKKDYSLQESNQEKTYILNSNLHKPNFSFSF